MRSSDGIPIIQQYLEFYLTKPSDRKRMFMDDFKEFLNKKNDLSLDQQSIVEGMDQLLKKMKTQINPLTSRDSFKNFPPFPNDEEKRQEMMTELAEVFKEIIDASEINIALNNNKSISQTLNLTEARLVGGLCFAMLEHIYPPYSYS